MRLTILFDGTVGKDNLFYFNLDLSQCNLPEDFWALQWEEFKINKGHIEFRSPLKQNEEITSLPSWTDCCIAKWQEADDAAKAAELLAAQQMQQLHP